MWIRCYIIFILKDFLSIHWLINVKIIFLLLLYNLSLFSIFFSYIYTSKKYKKFLGFHGISWDFWDFFGIFGIFGIFVGKLGFFGIFWDFLGFFGIFWDFLGFSGINPKNPECIRLDLHPLFQSLASIELSILIKIIHQYILLRALVPRMKL